MTLNHMIFTRKELPNLNFSTESLKEIASVIENDWKVEPHHPAHQYIVALKTLTGVKDYYYQDSAITIVAGFIEHSRQWNTITAKAIKDELRKRIK